MHVVGFNFSSQGVEPLLTSVVDRFLELVRHAQYRLADQVKILGDVTGRALFVHLSDEVYPAGEAYVGGLQEGIGRVGKLPLALSAAVAVKTVPMVLLAGLDVLRATIWALHAPGLSAVALVGQKGLFAQRHGGGEQDSCLCFEECSDYPSCLFLHKSVEIIP
jgi:hypothetical protein